MQKRTLIGFAIAMSATIIATVVYTTSNARDEPTAAMVFAPVKVALATVQRGTVAHTFSGIGELEAALQLQLATEVSGRVTRIAFESGQSVKAGQLLVQLNDAPEQAERLRLQAQLRNAETIHARTRRLVAENAATKEQLDNALAERDMAIGALRHTEAIIAQKALRAPFAGVLGIRHIHEGQYLNVAEPVASLIDARTLHVNFALDEQHAPSLKIGQEVTLSIDAYPERRFLARVTAIDPLIARSRTVQVQATLPNPDDALKAGMYTNILVAQPDAPPVLTVPETAVTYTAYGETVFLAQRKDPQQALTVKRVAVKVGPRLEGRVEIESGLKAGDQVVTSGQIRLSDDMVVEALPTDTLSEAAPTTTASGA